MEYVGLHAHSTFSYGDGYGLPREHADRVAALGGKALAQTDHGNVTGHVKHEQACIAAGIKPIFGCEVYTAPADMREQKNLRKWHLTVLAQNQLGYRNLLQLVSRSWDEGFYRWPTVSGPMLSEYSEGLIVLSGCSDSHLNCVLLGGKGIPEAKTPRYAEAKRTALIYKEIFGDRYYLEVQQFPELERTRTINKIFERLSLDTGIPLVATADVHYPHPDDNEMQKILHAASRNTGTVAAAEASWEYDIRLTHPISDDFILERLEKTGLSTRAAVMAVENTALIAARCNVVLPKADWLKYPLPPGVNTSDELIWAWLREGWDYRLKMNAHMRAHKKEYVARVKYEMPGILEKKFADYFCMLSDVVRFAKDSGIPVGPARGSAAASLVCYLLRITEVDPMQFPDMIFERFIDTNRTDLPDVDLDFDDELRYQIRDHLVEMYGAERVGNLGNHTRYRGKNSIVDVCRVYNIPRWSEEIVKGLVIERSGGDSRFDASLEDTFEMFPQAHQQLEMFPQLANAIRLEGNFKGLGVHACGLVVCNSPINDFVATYSREVKGHKVEVVSVDKYDAEHLNLLKADFLSLTTMGMIRHALEMTGMTLEELYQVPLTEPDTLAAFRRNDVIGIFQFEGRATRLVNADVVPESFAELTDVNTLSRPGPLFSSATHRYVETKHGRTPSEHLHPLLDDITSHTQYQIIYQEQILKICGDVGDLGWVHRNAIRKIISAKKGEAAMNALQGEFVTGAARKGVDSEVALAIWARMVTAGTYAFCTSGDTVVNTGGGGSRGGQSYTLEALWDAYNSKTSLGAKLRYGQNGRRINLQQMDEDSRIRPAQFRSIKRSEVKMPVYQITLANGRQVKATIMHRVLTTAGYLEVGDLSVGQSLVCVGEKEKPETAGQSWHAHGGSMTGSGNPAWIDGRTPMLREAQSEVLERSGNRCEHCSAGGRVQGHDLEYAHILSLNDLDGEYSRYHSAVNILRLCNSCHKKFDYKKGERHKRNTVGYPAVASEILKIEQMDELQWVYMIEMADSNHNYVGNGIVHHNNVAHAVSYTMIAFWSMWIKVHKPLAFYAASLLKADPKKWARLIKDAERHGIAVLPPDLAISGRTWSPDVVRRAVRAGFEQVPGIGGKTTDAILAERERAAFATWKDLIRVKGIGPKTVETIRAFADSDDPFKMQETKNILDEVRGLLKARVLGPIPRPTHNSDEMPPDMDQTRVVFVGRVRSKNYQDYIENQRARTGEEVEQILARMDNRDKVTSCVVHCYDEGDEDVYLRFERRKSFPNHKRLLETLRTNGSDVVVVAGLKRAGFGVVVQVSKMWVLAVDEDDSEEHTEEMSS